MEDCLDVVAIRIQDERAVIPGMVGTLAGSAVIAAAFHIACNIDPRKITFQGPPSGR